MPAKIRLCQVRVENVQYSFGLGLMLSWLLLAQPPLLSAQTAGAAGSGTNQTTLNDRPSLSTSVHSSSNSRNIHGSQAGVDRAGFSGKPSPVKPAQNFRVSPSNLSSFGPGGYSNVLQPFLGNADWLGNSFLPSSPSHPHIRPPWAERHHRKDDLLAIPVFVPFAPGVYDDSEANPDSSAEAQFSDTDEMNDEEAPEDASEQIAPEVPPDPVVVQPATVLVFKDGHRSDVVNYAIVGDTLFDFADGLTRKIQLATIDLAATQKANEAIGVEFKLPPASSR